MRPSEANSTPISTPRQPGRTWCPSLSGVQSAGQRETSVSVDDHLRAALNAYDQKNLPLAAGFCEELLEEGHRPGLALTLLGLTSMHISEFWRAIELFREVIALNPGDPEVKQQLELARKLLREQALRRADGR